MKKKFTQRCLAAVSAFLMITSALPAGFAYADGTEQPEQEQSEQSSQVSNVNNTEEESGSVLLLSSGTLDGDKLAHNFYKASWDTGIAALGEFVPGGKTIGAFINSMFGGVLFPSGPSNADIVNQISGLRDEINTRFAEVNLNIDNSTEEIKKKIQTTGVISAYGPRFDDMYTSAGTTHDNLKSKENDTSLTDVQKIIQMGAVLGNDGTWSDASSPIHILKNNQAVLYGTTLADTDGRDFYTVVYDDCKVSAMFSGEALDYASPYIDRLMLQQIYSYSVLMEALAAKRRMMQLTDEQLAEIETYSAIDQAYYMGLYNNNRASIERIEEEMTILSDNMFGEGESIWRHYCNFKNTYRLTYINKGNDSKDLFADMLYQRTGSNYLAVSEVSSKVRDSVMNGSTMSSADNLNVFNWAKARNMTLRDYLRGVGFNMDDVPTSPTPVCLSLGEYEDYNSKVSFGPEGGLIHGYLWYIRYRGADIDQVSSDSKRSLGRYGKAGKDKYESEARRWDTTYNGCVVNFKGETDGSHVDKTTIHSITVNGEHISSMSGSTWGYNGDVAEITLMPEDSYDLTSAVITTAGGEVVPYDGLMHLERRGGRCLLRFTMPDSDVTVSVTCERIAMTASVEVENGRIAVVEFDGGTTHSIINHKVVLDVGKKMIVYLFPKNGFKLESFSVTDEDGNEYAERDETSDAWFFLTVPDVETVHIKAVFAEPEKFLTFTGDGAMYLHGSDYDNAKPGDEIILRNAANLLKLSDDRVMNITVETIDGETVETTLLPEKDGYSFIMPEGKTVVNATLSDTKWWWYREASSKYSLHVLVDGKELPVTRYDTTTRTNRHGTFTTYHAGYVEWQSIEYKVPNVNNYASKITVVSENCTVKADPYFYNPYNNDYEFEVIPDEGFEVKSITAHDSVDRTVTKGSGNTYSVYIQTDATITVKCAPIAPALTDSCSLTIDNGKFGLNFFADTKGRDEDKMSVRFSDGTTANGTKTADGMMKFSCYIYPKNISAKVTATLMYDGTAVGSVSHSVEEYCDALLASDADPLTKRMVQGTYDYGMAARYYFYGTAIPAASRERAEAVVIPEDAFKYHATGVGKVQGYNHTGFSFILDSDITLREYFEIDTDTDISEYSFIVDGNRVTPKKKGTYYYIDIPGIQPQDLDNMHTYYVYKGSRTAAIDSGSVFELKYAPTTWMYNRVYGGASTEEKLSTLCKAIYAYHTAAEAYTDAH